MKYSVNFLLFILLSMVSFQTCAHPRPNDVAIDIITADGNVLSQYPANNSKHRRYIEARRNQNYGIRVRNKSNRRIGLVIAVDGRNIISGQKSQLQANERMYILGPHEQATYNGWRTSQKRINRFYFTTVDDSYADAWGDRSAMGVIAVATYREKYRPRQKKIAPQGRFKSHKDRTGKPEAAAEAMAPQPGTGFGQEQWSPARLVQFEPDTRQSAKYFLKYEWRQTLCDKGVISCGQPRNRLWPEENGEGFAPHPPQRLDG